MKFLDAQEYNKAINGDKRFNCFAGALSITNPPCSCKGFRLEKGDISKSFINLARTYGIHVKEVPSIEDAHGRYGFIVLGFFPRVVNYIILQTIESIDFHVFRINPDGTIFNKMDEKTPAKDLKNISDQQLDLYREELEAGLYHVFVIA